MKIATLKDSFNQVHKDIFYLETMEDFNEFKKLSNDTNDDEITLAIKTDIPESKWDHVFDGSLGGMQTGVLTSNIIGGNPIYLSSAILNSKLDRIEELINDNFVVIVNRRGGFFPIVESMNIEIIEINEYTANKLQYVSIKDNTKIINLENDLRLEQHSINFMEARDPNYSTIRKLKLFDFLELVDIFNKFIEKGGRVAYIYTTGIDVQQMMVYTNALIIAGVSKVHFEFNAGIDNKIQSFLDSLKKCDIEVIVNEL